MAEALNHAEYVARRDRAPEFLADLMEHTAEVLAEAGLGADEIARMLASGAAAGEG